MFAYYHSLNSGDLDDQGEFLRTPAAWLTTRFQPAPIASEEEIETIGEDDDLGDDDQDELYSDIWNEIQEEELDDLAGANDGADDEDLDEDDDEVEGCSKCGHTFTQHYVMQ